MLDLTDPIVLGRELIIESANRIFVERAFPTGRGDLRYFLLGDPRRLGPVGGRADRLVELAPMVRLLVAVAIVAVAAGVAAMVNRRRRADPPTQPRGEIPANSTAPTSPSPTAPWLVAVFSSETCHTCADVIAKAEVMRSDDVAVDVVPSRPAATCTSATRSTPCRAS